MKKNPDSNPDTLGFMDSDPKKSAKPQDKDAKSDPPAKFMRKGRISITLYNFPDSDPKKSEPNENDTKTYTEKPYLPHKL